MILWFFNALLFYMFSLLFLGDSIAYLLSLLTRFRPLMITFAFINLFSTFSCDLFDASLSWVFYGQFLMINELTWRHLLELNVIFGWKRATALTSLQVDLFSAFCWHSLFWSRSHPPLFEKHAFLCSIWGFTWSQSLKLKFFINLFDLFSLSILIEFIGIKRCAHFWVSLIDIDEINDWLIVVGHESDLHGLKIIWLLTALFLLVFFVILFWLSFGMALTDPHLPFLGHRSINTLFF